MKTKKYSYTNKNELTFKNEGGEHYVEGTFFRNFEDFDELEIKTALSEFEYSLNETPKFLRIFSDVRDPKRYSDFLISDFVLVMEKIYFDDSTKTIKGKAKFLNISKNF